MNAKREQYCVSCRLVNACITTSTRNVGFHDAVYSHSDKLILPPVRQIFASLSIVYGISFVDINSEMYLDRGYCIQPQVFVLQIKRPVH